MSISNEEFIKEAINIGTRNKSQSSLKLIKEKSVIDETQSQASSFTQSDSVSDISSYTSSSNLEANHNKGAEDSFKSSSDFNYILSSNNKNQSGDLKEDKQASSTTETSSKEKAKLKFSFTKFKEMFNMATKQCSKLSEMKEPTGPRTRSTSRRIMQTNEQQIKTKLKSEKTSCPFKLEPVNSKGTMKQISLDQKSSQSVEMIEGETQSSHASDTSKSHTSCASNNKPNHTDTPRPVPKHLKSTVNIADNHVVIDINQHLEYPTQTFVRRRTRDAILQDHGYDLQTEIGSGSYAKVYTIAKRWDIVGHEYERKDWKDMGTMAAVKIISQRVAPSDYVRKFLPRELVIMPTLSHQNVVKTFDIKKEDPRSDPDLRIFIYMEWADAGDLLTFIKARKVLGETLSRLYLRQLSDALLYLHSKNICHRDIKCENVLLFNRKMLCKLGDFGFARYYTPGSSSSSVGQLSHVRLPNLKTFCGSVAYSAPELLAANEYDPRETDIWSLGCVFYIMLYGMFPYRDEKNTKSVLDQQRSRRLQHKELPLDSPAIRRIPPISEDAVQIVSSMLEPDPHQRINLNQLRYHKWTSVPGPPVDELLKFIECPKNMQNNVVAQRPHDSNVSSSPRVCKKGYQLQNAHNFHCSSAREANQSNSFPSPEQTNNYTFGNNAKYSSQHYSNLTWLGTDSTPSGPPNNSPLAKNYQDSLTLPKIDTKIEVFQTGPNRDDVGSSYDQNCCNPSGPTKFGQADWRAYSGMNAKGTNKPYSSHIANSPNGVSDSSANLCPNTFEINHEIDSTPPVPLAQQVFSHQMKQYNANRQLNQSGRSTSSKKH